MVGLHIPLPAVTFVGSDAPTLPSFDPVAPGDGVGALLLIEANHPLGGNFSVPVNGAAITNILREPAADLLGVAASTLDPLQVVGNMATTYGKVELTTLGGIHAIQSTTHGTTTGYGYQINYPTNIVTYMKANSAHAFYQSVWNMPTKIIPGVYNSNFVQRATPGGYAFGMGNFGVGVAGQTIVGRQNATSLGVVDTPWCSAHAVINTEATWISQAAGLYSTWEGMYEVGNFGPINRTGKNGARVLWRIYIEDLTVSGRTYAQVVALDNAEFARQVTTAGGRYYSDTTPTDPATFT